MEIGKYPKLYLDECRHVNHIELATPAYDIDLWEYALKNNMIIVTNDEDFLNLLNVKGFPPKVIFLKLAIKAATVILSPY